NIATSPQVRPLESVAGSLGWVIEARLAIKGIDVSKRLARHAWSDGPGKLPELGGKPRQVDPQLQEGARGTRIPSAKKDSRARSQTISLDRRGSPKSHIADS